MAREGTQLIRIPLEQGIRAFGDLYTIGPQCRLLQNLSFDPRLTSGTVGRGLRFSYTPDTGSATWTLTDTGDASHTNQYLTGLVTGQVDVTITEPKLYAVGIFARAGGHELGLWDVIANNAIHGATSVAVPNSGALLGATARQHAVAAWWPSRNAIYAAQPTLPGSSGAATSFVKFTLGGGAAAWTAPGSGILISALIQHLDRLWFSGNSAFGTWHDTVRYTDPFDDTTVRATSFIVCPGLGRVTALARASVGDIDAAAQAHLCIFGQEQVWVFDGDPQFGFQQASLRRLTINIGTPSQTCVVETEFGVVFLGQDGRLHLIPTGGAILDPPGWREKVEPIRGLIAGTLFTAIPDTNLPATLSWESPILMVILGNKSGHLEGDFTDPERPIWTGPHTSGNAVAAFCATRRPPSPAVGGPSVATVHQGAMAVSNFNTNPASRTQQLRTGFLWAPGHDVELYRILITTFRKTSASALTVAAVKSDGTSVTFKRVGGPTVDAPDTTTSSQAAHKVTTTSFAPIGLGSISANAIYLDITGVAATEMDLIRVEAEVRMQPRQQFGQ